MPARVTGRPVLLIKTGFLAALLVMMTIGGTAEAQSGGQPPPFPPANVRVQSEGENALVTWEDWLSGDHNLDGTVNGQDVFLLAARFNQTSGFNGNVEETPGNDCIDANMDGLLNGLDLFPVSAGFLNEISGYNVYVRYTSVGLMERVTSLEGIPYSGCRSTGELSFVPDELPVWIALSASGTGEEGPMSTEVRFGDEWVVDLGGGVSMTFLWVEGGTVRLGSPEGEFERREREGPYQEVELPGFFVMETEVTNSQFGRFMQAGGYSNDIYWEYGTDWRGENGFDAPRYWDSGEFNSGPAYPDHPVQGVSWYETAAFCNWVSELTGQNVRLPYEPEWEFAAEGLTIDGELRLYPWGDIGGNNDGLDGLDMASANSFHDIDPDSFQFTSPVGFFGNGSSAVGALDMAGSVWEWTSENWRDEYSLPWEPSWFDDSWFDPVIRSGSFSREAGVLRCSYRNSAPADARENDLGFRPVRTDTDGL